MLTKPRTPVMAPSRRISPIERAVAESGCYRLSEAAEMLGVAPITLRRLLKKPGINAPSKELVHEGENGEYRTYLYTPADIKELKRYFEGRTTIQKRSA